MISYQNFKKYLLSILCCIISSIPVWAQNFVHTVYKTDDGLPSNLTFSTVQDSKGYIWFATNKGVCKFNGSNFTTFTDAEGLTDNSTIRLFCDSKDRIWVSTLNGKPCYIQHNKVYSAKNDKSLAQINSTATLGIISEDNNHNIYLNATASNAFWQITPESAVKKFEGSPFISNGKLNWYYTVKHNNEVQVISPYGIAKLNKLNEVTPFTDSAEILRKNALNIITASPDRAAIFYLTGNGIASCHLTNSSFKKEVVFDNNIKANNCKALYATHNKLWVSFNQGGIACYEKQQDTWHYKYTLLKDIEVNHLFEDAEGNYWLTSNLSGVIFLPKFYERVSLLNTIIENQQLPANCLATFNNELWVGTSDYKILHYNNNEFMRTITLHKTNATYGKFVYKILANQTNIYTSFSNGFFRFNRASKQVTEVFEKGIEYKQNSISVKNFSLQPNGTIYVAAGVRDFLVPSTLNSAHSLSKSIGTRSFYTYTDPLGNCFVSNTKGLAVFKDSAYHYVDTTNEVLSGRINSICYVEADKYIIGNSRGLFLWHHKKLTKLISSNGVVTNNECIKVQRKFNSIWVLQNNAIFEIDIVHDSMVNIKSILSVANGILPYPPNDMDETETKLYIATNKGILVFNKAEAITKPKYAVNISSFVSGNKNYIFENNPTIQSANGAITIYLDILSYGSKSQNEFEYKLSKNAPWLTLNASNLQLDNLDHGQHILYIRGKIHDGEWSKTISYSFYYHIPFYKRLWAKLLALLAICGVAFYFYQRNQKKKFVAEQEKYEMKNKIATMENQALQSLMHPHFVFNSLNSIQSYINNNDKENANRYLSRFAKLIRLNLNSGINGFITIDDEIERLQLYLSLEQLRFEKQFSFSIEAGKDLDTEELYLPSMILQPFIENSIWHGILPSKEKGNISIKFSIIEKEFIKITIVDNGIGITNSKAHTTSKKHESKGLSLIASRLLLLSEKYQKAFHIKESIPFTSFSNPGHEVIVQVPFLYTEDIT
jgi:ligand-binding sensor domain-containing protein/anti-sigma regulatory factor (Ser/Thr protein kinase)